MRKFPALVTVLGLTALTLTGCVSVGAPGCSAPAEGSAELQSQVSVSGAVGSLPEVAISTPMHVDTATSWTTETGGEGVPIEADDQLVGVDIAVYDATTGEKLGQTAFDQNPGSNLSTVGNWTNTFPQFGELMQCATPGSRVVLALPPDGVSEQAAPDLGVGPDTSTVVIVDVTDSFLTRATGPTVFNDAHGMPTVVRASNGQPGIIVPNATPPATTTVQTLVDGEGAKIEDDDAVVVQYTGIAWDTTADPFATTWGDSPVAVDPATAAIPGFSDAIAGQTVGSQVLVVVPASEVPAEATDVPADTAVVYVIDVLGTMVPPTAATR